MGLLNSCSSSNSCRLVVSVEQSSGQVQVVFPVLGRNSGYISFVHFTGRLFAFGGVRACVFQSMIFFLSQLNLFKPIARAIKMIKVVGALTANTTHQLTLASSTNCSYVIKLEASYPRRCYHTNLHCHIAAEQGTSSRRAGVYIPNYGTTGRNPSMRAPMLPSIQ